MNLMTKFDQISFDFGPLIKFYVRISKNSIKILFRYVKFAPITSL